VRRQHVLLLLAVALTLPPLGVVGRSAAGPEEPGQVRPRLPPDQGGLMAAEDLRGSDRVPVDGMSEFDPEERPCMPAEVDGEVQVVDVSALLNRSGVRSPNTTAHQRDCLTGSAANRESAAP
jgi:hypothetical protein